MKLAYLHRIAFSTLAVCGALSLPTASLAQSKETGPKGKPKWSVSWGWNWEGYSKSDIHFTGSDHNFTLKNVSAAAHGILRLANHASPTTNNPSQSE